MVAVRWWSRVATVMALVVVVGCDAGVLGGGGWHTVTGPSSVLLGRLYLAGKDRAYVDSMGSGPSTDVVDGYIVVHGQGATSSTSDADDDPAVAQLRGWRRDAAGGQLQLWLAGRWQTPPALPPVLAVSQVLRVDGGQAWIAGHLNDDMGSQDNAAYLGHWTGGSLLTVTGPQNPTSVFLDGSGRLWGITFDGVMLSWDGSAWKHPLVSSPEGSAHVNGLVSSGGTDYAYGDTLLRRTPHGWQRVKIPDGVTFTAAAGDGHAGLWLGAGSRYYHYRGGHWSSTAVADPVRSIFGACPPSECGSPIITAMAQVPGSTSVWSVIRSENAEQMIPEATVVQRYNVS